MNRRCKSISRALKRGHPVQGDCFYSKNDTRILRQKFEAWKRRKELEQTQEEN